MKRMLEIAGKAMDVIIAVMAVIMIAMYANLWMTARTSAQIERAEQAAFMEVNGNG